MRTKKLGHVVLVPFPALGHITPLLELAKLLHANHSIHITFVLTDYNFTRLATVKGSDAVAGLPDFRFRTIPDGLPSSDTFDTTQDIPSLCKSTSQTCLPHLTELLKSLNNDVDEGVPPVTCVVADGVMSFALDAADAIGVPCALFWTTSACGFMAYLHYKDLIATGLTPLHLHYKDLIATGLTPLQSIDDLTEGYLNMPIDLVPGMPNLRFRDFPSFVRTTHSDENIVLHFIIRECQRANRASAVILNTFEELESNVINAMSSLLAPPVYTLGPLHFLTRKLDSTHSSSSLTSSLWQEDTSCIYWLDTKKPNSVLYVNFGSITVMTNEQLVEFAWGLANADVDFLWVIRPDLVRGSAAVIPEEFHAKTKGRGFISQWCVQPKVLEHPAVGGFLTHSGWNSTLESIGTGVPMLCWPFFAEQQTNCRYVCKEWGVGMEIRNDVTREEVEKLIWELMNGNKGKEMRAKAAEWKDAANKAAGCGGSSGKNLDKLVREVLLAEK